MPARLDARTLSPITPLSGRSGGLLLTGLGVLCASAVAAASLRHTGSLAFPIDDGYIYSNYVAAASQGHFFTYNLGETSGGITGLGWYVLCLLAYGLISPFHSLLGGLGPAIVWDDPALSAQAGHLYLAAYLPGVLCLLAAGLGAWRLADLLFPPDDAKPHTRTVAVWLTGAVAVADLGLVWGAMSGLEAALSAALAVWAVYLLAAEYRRGRLRWSLLLAAALPWARPDLVVFGAAGFAWLLIRSAAAHGSSQKRASLGMAAAYIAALAAGFGLMMLGYFVGWGRPLPSSFYAKVGGLRLGTRFFSSVEELLTAGRALPFLAGLAALLGGISAFFSRSDGRGASDESRWGTALLLMAGGGYVTGIMLTLPWFGQEDRYLLPVHPFIVVLGGMLLWRIARVLPLERLLAGRYASPVVAFAFIALLVGANYLWATRNYAVQVRNIADGHIAPARWLAGHTPPDAVIASEPIGAVKLFSERRTVDLVGLTTPATLGTYRDWPRALPALEQEGAQYLLFYPDWFDGHTPPPWAEERQRFSIPDNRIVGSSVIAVYKLPCRSSAECAKSGGDRVQATWPGRK